MCLSPIVRKSNKKYFLPGRWESFYQEFPCGQCEECRRNRELDEYVRTNWEAKYVFNQLGGYAIFDTLSYRNECLPHVSDVCDDLGISLWRGELFSGLNLSCFRLADWRSFLLNLNSRITNLVIRKIQDVLAENYELDYGQRYIKKNINDLFNMAFGRMMPKHWYNYVMASEYGHDDDYIDDSGRVRHGTVRPHYHVIFFSYLPSYILSPEDFSHAVSEAWNRGRTDGVDWPCKKHKTKYEWKKVRVFEEADDTFHINVLNVLSYISKYIHKDEGMLEKFGNIEEFLFEWLFPYDFDDYWKLESADYKVWLLWKRFKRNLFNFSKHGHDFGIYYIDWLKSEEGKQEFDHVCSKGYIVMEMNKSQTKYNHTLPVYYANKLFKESYIDSDGYKHWRYNDLGLRFKRSQIVASMDNMQKKFRDFVMNTDCQEVHDIIARNNDRFYAKVAIWYRLYEGRIMSDDVKWVDFGHIDVRSLPTPDEMLDIIVGNLDYNSDADFVNEILRNVGDRMLFNKKPIIYNYSTPKDIAHFGGEFLADRNLGNSQDGYVSLRNHDLGWNVIEGKYIPLKNNSLDNFNKIDSNFYYARNVLRVSIVKGYEDVGRFMKLYRRYVNEVSQKKQEAAEFKRELEKRQKVLGLKKNNKNIYDE